MKFLLSGLFAVAMAAEPLPDKLASVSAKQVPIRDVLAQILPQSGMKYDIDSKITNARLITVEAKDIPWSRIFKMVLGEAHLIYEVDKAGVLHVKPSP